MTALTRIMASLALGLTLGLALGLIAGPAMAQAQSDLSVTIKGSDTLQSTNSGQVTLSGGISGGSIGGTDNYVSQGAQGAATSYTQTNTAWSTNGAIDSNAPVSVSGISQSGTNSGDVTINSTVSGVALTGKNASVSVSGIGTVNSITVKTTAK